MKCPTGLAAVAVAVLGSAGPVGAAVITYTAVLDGPTEGNASTATGTAIVDVDPVAHTLRLRTSFSGLGSNTTAAHIHAPTATPLTGTAGVATTTPYFAGFPIGVTSGSYDNTLDLTLSSSYNASFVTANGGTTAGAEAALENAIAQGRAYLNIHTSNFPGGEIRGFLVVPEPSSAGLLAVAGAVATGIRRRRSAVIV